MPRVMRSPPWSRLTKYPNGSETLPNVTKRSRFFVIVACAVFVFTPLHLSGGVVVLGALYSTWCAERYKACLDKRDEYEK